MQIPQQDIAFLARAIIRVYMILVASTCRTKPVIYDEHLYGPGRLLKTASNGQESHTKEQQITGVVWVHSCGLYACDLCHLCDCSRTGGRAEGTSGSACMYVTDDTDVNLSFHPFLLG